MTMTPIRTLFERHYIPEPNSGCWLWTGSVAKNGYGRFGKYPASLAHRLSWELNCGVIPKGIYVLHRCDMPCCVNPDHLFLGTQKENIQDCRSKGRLNKPKGAKRWNAKLTDDQVMEMRQSSESHADLARRFGVSPGLVGNIRHGRGWAHIA